MSILKPFSKLPALNAASILLVENEEKLQQELANALAQQQESLTVNVRLARCLPLPVENEASRPRIDLVVFIINLTSERSLESTKTSLEFLDPGYFLGKVCFVVTNARNASVCSESLDSVRKLAASLHCPLLYADDQTPDGVTNIAERLLTILKVAAGLVPMTTALYLSSLTRCLVPSDVSQQNFD